VWAKGERLPVPKKRELIRPTGGTRYFRTIGARCYQRKKEAISTLFSTFALLH